MDACVLESPDNLLQTIQSLRKPFSIDFVMSGTLAPGFLAKENRLKAAAPGQSQRLVKLRLSKVCEEKIRLLDPRRFLVPDSARVWPGQPRRHFETLNRFQKVLFATRQHSEIGWFDAMSLLGFHREVHD